MNTADLTRRSIVEISDRINFIQEAKGSLLKYKKTEYTMECFIQTSVRLIMMALFLTETSTTSGLRAVFLEKGRMKIFILQTIWSMISICRTFVTIKTNNKSGPIPIGGQLVFMFRALLSVGTRIGCFILYLTPFLGLFSIH
jgi:hypothetical protein